MGGYAIYDDQAGDGLSLPAETKRGIAKLVAMWASWQKSLGILRVFQVANWQCCGNLETGNLRPGKHGKVGVCNRVEVRDWLRAETIQRRMFRWYAVTAATE